MTTAEILVHYRECKQDPCTCTELEAESAALDEYHDRDCSHPCNGTCCRSFDLPLSPVEFGRKRAGGKGMDIVAITDMLIYQGLHRRPPVEGVKSSHDGRRLDHYYGCKHFDDATGRCTNYENRPLMCRSFPYSTPCPYEGCGYKKPEAT